MAKPKPPTDTYITEMARYMVEKYGGRNERIQRVFDQRFRKRKVKIPDAFAATASEFRPPFTFDLIRRASSLMAGDLPRPVVSPAKVGAKGQENSSLREKWLYQSYKEMNKGKNVFAEVVDALAADGECWWKCRLKEHQWNNVVKQDNEEADAYNQREQLHRQRNFPFSWEHVATSTVFPRYDDDGLAEVWEITEREKWPVYEKYGLGDGESIGTINLLPSINPQSGAISTSTTTVVEHWTRNWFTVLVEDKVVSQKRHNYRRPPYFHALLHTTSVKDPSYQGIGIADPILDLEELIGSASTIQLNWGYINGFPAITGDPISDNSIPLKEGVTLKWEPGKFVYLPDYKIRWLQAPPVGQDLTSLREFFKQTADQVSLAPILYGLPPGGDASGTLANTLIAVAKSIFGTGMSNLARAFDEQAGWMWSMIENVLNKPVPLYHEGDDKWLELGPSDIDGYYEVTHKLQPIIPAERQVMATMLADAQARGAITMNRLREDGYGIEAPEEEDTAVKVEQMRMDPRYKQRLFDRFDEWIGGPPMGPPAGVGPQPVPPVGPGGFGQPQLAGVQQPMMPGGPMAATPPQMGP